MSARKDNTSERNAALERDSKTLKIVIKYLEDRVESIESSIEKELNPLHRVELEVARRENAILLHKIKELQELNVPSVVKSIFKDLLN